MAESKEDISIGKPGAKKKLCIWLAEYESGTKLLVKYFKG
jgi:hypothetical protein